MKVRPYQGHPAWCNVLWTTSGEGAGEMAKHTITRECGHEDEVELHGPKRP